MSPEFEAMIRRGKRREACAAALIDRALAMPLPRLVLVKGDRKILLCRNIGEKPYRITDLDSLGPSGHREFDASDRKGWLSMDAEISAAIAAGYRLERRKRAA